MNTKGKQYYGAFFWVAAISFIVPLFVAWKAFEARPTTKPTPNPDVSGVDHAIWDYLLKSYVSGGLIDYDGFKKDYLFRDYIRQLGSCDPTALANNEEKLALACNAYNAFVINGVISHKISDSVISFKQEEIGFFDLPEHIYAGKTVSLNELEHQMIRPTFGDPRIHVALVCAAKSCPAIRGEAYTGQSIDAQLDDQSLQFANNPKYVQFDSETRKLMLSPILDWYGGDWNEKYPGGYLEWLESLANEQKLINTIVEAREGKTEVGFFEYDWSLNSQNPHGGDTGGAKSGFGSGTIAE